jgi:hypothetical protein
LFVRGKIKILSLLCRLALVRHKIRKYIPWALKAVLGKRSKYVTPINFFLCLGVGVCTASISTTNYWGFFFLIELEEIILIQFIKQICVQNTCWIVIVIFPFFFFFFFFCFLSFSNLVTIFALKDNILKTFISKI